ncbi:kinase-like protein [Rickenella mellea]|uniref:Kinase-like protein n=1 Tax=Rickenella mellea TaxID=50990 RepID=A0A4Y7PSM8_9AGAM|nr:kinase-like protein [Rickenella mellea]
MPTLWRDRKARLKALLGSDGDEEEEGLALDRILHGQSVIGKTAKTVEIDELRFSEKDLQISGTLARGQFGVVELVTCRVDGRVYVQKRVEKKSAIRMREQCSPQIERDVLLLAMKSRTPWVPQMLCAFQSTNHVNIVMQYADGGSLWDVIESCGDDGRISQGDLRWWVPQCVSAIHWCHSQGFVHRDIKPHNFILTSSSHLQIIDFGSAAPLLPSRPDGVQLIPKKHCLVPCGTCDYISPEILKAHEDALIALEMTDDTARDSNHSRVNSELADPFEGGYGRETDWWSLGAMIYEMAYGVAPFFAKDIGQTYLRIMDHERSLKFHNTIDVSADLVSLLRGLLCHHEHRLGRHSIDEILRLSLFKGVQWASLHTLTAPPDLHLPQFVYSTPQRDVRGQDHQALSDSSSFSKPFAFSALFQSSRVSTASPGLSILHPTPARGGLSVSDQLSIGSFIGLSWGPTRDAFDSPPSFSNTPRQTRLSPPHFQPFSGTSPGHPVADTANFATPVRPTTLHAQHTLTRTSTVRRTAPRRVVTDREAMQQLIDCVGQSARKRVLQSGRTPRMLYDNTTFRSNRDLTIRASTSRSFSKPKELRFAVSSGSSANGGVGVPELVFDEASESSAAESSDAEGWLSPSPSPRPGSAMSMISRRSTTPTVTASGTGTGSFPFVRDQSRRGSGSAGIGRSGESTPTTPAAVFSNANATVALARTPAAVAASLPALHGPSRLSGLSSRPDPNDHISKPKRAVAASAHNHDQPKQPAKQLIPTPPSTINVNSTLPDVMFDDMERRLAKLFRDIGNVERRLEGVSLSIHRP